MRINSQLLDITLIAGACRGIPAYEFEKTPGANYDGFASYDPVDGPAIAFNISDWKHLTPPIDASIVVAYVATAYHEVAHATYEAFFSDWCANNSALCTAFKTCLENKPVDPP